MKKTCILLLMSSFLIMSMGCEENPESGGIENVVVVDTFMNECNYDLCSKSFWVSFEDPKGFGADHWYWVEIGPAAGKPVKMHNTGDTMQIKGTANYFDFPVAGWHNLYVSSCESFEDAGKKATRGYGQLQENVYIPEFGNECFTDCCTDKELHNGWYWVTGKRADTSDGGIVEAKSYILSTYGTLCGECVAVDVPAHQVGFVNISYETTENGLEMWAQTGFFRRRRPGDTHATFGRYAEVARSPIDVYSAHDSISHISYEGSQVMFELKLNKSTGEWSFLNNGIEWLVWLPEPNWVNKTGNSVQWTGEIYGRETDMPGIHSNRCILDVCRYRSDSDPVWKQAHFLDSDTEVGGNDLSEWGIKPTSQETIEIWDINPL